MPYPKLPQDLVYEIALVLRGTDPDKEDTTLLPTISSVCRSWRYALLPLVFKTLYVRCGQERRCAEFLRTQNGQEITKAVSSIKFKTRFESLVPVFLDLLSLLPCLGLVGVDIDTFEPTTYEEFNRSLPQDPRRIKAMTLTIPKITSEASYCKLVAFLNMFSNIHELAIAFRGDSEPSDDSRIKPVLGTVVAPPYDNYPADFIPRVAVLILYFVEQRGYPKIPVKMLINAFRLGGRVSLFKHLFFSSLDGQVETLEVFMDLSVASRDSLRSLNIIVPNSTAHHVNPAPDDDGWDVLWRSWKAQAERLACLASLCSLTIEFTVQVPEIDWENQYSSWSRVLIALTSLPPTLCWLRIMILGDPVAFKTHLIKAETITPLADKMARLTKLEQLYFVLELTPLYPRYEYLFRARELVDLIRKAVPEVDEEGILVIDYYKMLKD